jgi:hypothetical protein
MALIGKNLAAEEKKSSAKKSCERAGSKELREENERFLYRISPGIRNWSGKRDFKGSTYSSCSTYSNAKYMNEPKWLKRKQFKQIILDSSHIYK